jgi:hypothetical protein
MRTRIALVDEGAHDGIAAESLRLFRQRAHQVFDVRFTSEPNRLNKRHLIKRTCWRRLIGQIKLNARCGRAGGSK